MQADRVTQRASKTTQIGIFGGSFNPPHLAHLIVAEILREQFALDRILWIPNRQSPFKEKQELAPAEDRLEMTRLIVRDNDAFVTSDIEISRSGVSYTIDTIRDLQKENADARYHIIIGSDSLAEFGGWREPEEIVRRARLIVYPRPGFENADTPKAFEDRIRFADAPLLEISSTAIRRRRRENRSIRYMVPEVIHEYIFDRGLYAE